MDTRLQREDNVKAVHTPVMVVGDGTVAFSSSLALRIPALAACSLSSCFRLLVSALERRTASTQRTLEMEGGACCAWALGIAQGRGGIYLKLPAWSGVLYEAVGPVRDSMVWWWGAGLSSENNV